MNIFVLTATSSLNCFVLKAKQTKKPLAHAVITVLQEFSPPLPLFPKAVKDRLLLLVEVPLVAHALPQVVGPAKCSSFSEKLQRVQIDRAPNDPPVKLDTTCNGIGGPRWLS
jgi:hypothetical protein